MFCNRNRHRFSHDFLVLSPVFIILEMGLGVAAPI